MGAFNLAISRFYSVINSTLKFPTQGITHYQSLAKTAQFEIAQTHFESGNYSEAARFFERVQLIDISPEYMAKAAFMTGFSQGQAGDLDKAVTTFRIFILKYPEDPNVPQARYMLAVALSKLGKKEDAMQATLTLLKDLHKKSDADKATWSIWQKKVGNKIANDLFQSGDFANAVEIYKGLNALPDSGTWKFPVAYQIGICYERLNKKADAKLQFDLIIAAAKEASKKSPQDPELNQLAQLAQSHVDHLNWYNDATKQIDTYAVKAVNIKAVKPVPTEEVLPPGTTPLPKPLNP
jgi:tetratricopeptide (TPR) repeat protein